MLKISLNNTMLILLLLLNYTIEGMEGEPSYEDGVPLDSWEKAQANGPLSILDFYETESVDDKGRHFGWLFASEFNDQVFIAVTPHEEGYYIDYIEPTYKTSLPDGFYYWKSLNEIKMSPLSDFNYKVVRDQGSITIVPTIEYIPYSTDKIYKKASKLIYTGKRVDRYQYLDSFKKAFDDCCSKVYLFKKINPIKLTEQDKNFIKEEGILYMDFSEETKQSILRILPTSAYDVLKSWLENKLRNSGLLDLPYENRDSKEYIMGKTKIIDQFIIEHIVRFIQIFFDNSKQNQIDIYQILEAIEKLEPCSSQDRREFEEALLERFESWDAKRIVGLTAKGLINCNGGLLQWD